MTTAQLSGYTYYRHIAHTVVKSEAFEGAADMVF